MDLPGLIEALSDPRAFPGPVENIAVRQTHISAVFLTGLHAYKIKKPVNLGFLDFSTLEKRHHFCQEEVRLNRRLAPQVYLGVVPVASAGSGVQVEGTGPVVEWAVKMRRLPDAATVCERLRRGEVDVALAEALGAKVASFHRAAETNEHIASFGRFEAVARIILDVFAQAAAAIGTTVSTSVFARVKDLAEKELVRLRPVIEARAARGMPRDTHGDLHLDHVYVLPDQHPDDLVIIDCIEFNERFRFTDPVADMAFPVMDFLFHGRPDLASAFAGAYVRASGDTEGRALLPLYTAYRATVRGAVEGLLLAEKEVPEAERAAALVRARAHWLLALGKLEESGRKPCLVLVGGLPGTGKSTLGRALAERAGFRVVRSDVVRKELAGLPVEEPTPPPLRDQLYAAEATERTYAECRRRAEELLFEGERVLVDATFRDESWRRRFLDTATRWAVPGVLMVCQAGPETVQERLRGRGRDASDADWSIYLEATARWQPPGTLTCQALHEVSTDGSQEDGLTHALDVLRQLGVSE